MRCENQLKRIEILLWSMLIALALMSSMTVYEFISSADDSNASSASHWFSAGKVPSSTAEPSLHSVRLSPRVSVPIYIVNSQNDMPIYAIIAWHHGDLRIPIEYNAGTGQFDSCCYDVSFSLSGESQRDGVSDLEVVPTKILDNVVHVLLSIDDYQ